MNCTFTKTDGITVVQNFFFFFFYTKHLDAVDLAGNSKQNVRESLSTGVTSLGRQAGVPLGAWESVRVYAPLRASRTFDYCPQIWCGPDGTAARPGRRCVVLRSADGSAGPGL